MFWSFFPLKKLRRNSWYLLFGAIILVGAVAVYNQLVPSKGWKKNIGTNFDIEESTWMRAILDQPVKNMEQPKPVEELTEWARHFRPQTWKPDFMGQANLHVFEDWCGGSTAGLRNNMHYPLYPHSRTTVQKLAVSPRSTNYGLRIFGYLHPQTSGDYMFALSSADNSEFWLSTSDSPLDVQMLAWVGKTGKEWTAPGEFDKYASQISKPVGLSSRKRYFFEVIHKQDYKGTDHVVLEWQLLNHDFGFSVIESKHISLFANESALLMSDVSHIPQTVPSHQRTTTKQINAEVDMLREDLRDTLYQVNLIDIRYLEGVLPDCLYNPSYTIKDFPLSRYQGLQFVHLSHIFPNDYTRLTHMEIDNCFYRGSPYYMSLFGYSKYTSFDQQINRQTGNDDSFRMTPNREMEEEFNNEINEHVKKIKLKTQDNAIPPDYGDGYDDYFQKQRRQILSFNGQHDTGDKPSDPRSQYQGGKERMREDTFQQPPLPESRDALKHVRKNKTALTHESLAKMSGQKKSKGRGRQAKRKKVKFSKKQQQTTAPVHINPKLDKDKPGGPSEQLFSELRNSKTHNPDTHATKSPKNTETDPKMFAGQKKYPPSNLRVRDNVVITQQEESYPLKELRASEIELNKPLAGGEANNIRKDRKTALKKMYKMEENTTPQKSQWNFEEKIHKTTKNMTDGGVTNRRDPWWAEEYDPTPAPEFDVPVTWNNIFDVVHLDFQGHRFDGIDLECNISGNLVMQPADALPIVKAFMDSLNNKHHGRFTLLNIVNVVRRVDWSQGSRYLLELLLKDVSGRQIRLTHYIYASTEHTGQSSWDSGYQEHKLVLCNPVGLHWNPMAMVHFIVPVKNQGRWVKQLIADMEELFRETKDANFNLIITDYSSTDMDVRKALAQSSVPRFQYVRLSGNFERAAGLQAGIDLIEDDHSIVFLCDLHIRFPPFIIDSIRKHCVEGHMAFAPIVLRLNCGSTPWEARGYWEVNGFGLLGIYKSDLAAIGGMNTRDFKDTWGGEDWELLDRIIQAGMEVERIYLRNFFHHYHSKRGMWNHR